MDSKTSGTPGADAGCGSWAGQAMGRRARGKRAAHPADATRAANKEKKRLFRIRSVNTLEEKKKKGPLRLVRKRKKYWKRGP